MLAITLLAALATIYNDTGIRDWMKEQFNNQPSTPAPESAEAFITQGKAYAAQGNFEQAITEFDRALALDPDNAEAVYNRGNAYYGQRDYAPAIADFRRYLELEPTAPNRGFVENLISEMEAQLEN